jgi:hypothetical protein
MKSSRCTFIYIAVILFTTAFAPQACSIELNNFIDLGSITESNSKKIIGNKQLITKEISIGDYDKIKIIDNLVFNYRQSKESPYLQITIDDNVLEYLDIYVEKRTLIIAPKKDKTGLLSYDIRPTTFIVNSNSTELTDLNNVGSGTFNILSNIKSDNLKFKIAGSGNVTGEESIQVEELDIAIAGSGKVSLNGNTNNYKIQIAGSGSVSLNGNTNSGNINIAGSGDVSLSGNANSCNIDIAGSGGVKSYNYSVKDLTCRIAGSGDVKLNVENALSCKIAGSGNIFYTGNPATINQHVRGSGKIIKRSTPAK